MADNVSGAISELEQFKNQLNSTKTVLQDIAHSFNNIDASKFTEQLKTSFKNVESEIYKIRDIIIELSDTNAPDFDLEFSADALKDVNNIMTQTASKVTYLRSEYSKLIEAEKEAANAAKQSAKEQQSAENKKKKALEEFNSKNTQLINSQINMIKTVAAAVNSAVNNILKVIRGALKIIEKGIGLIVNTFKKIGSTIRGIIELFGSLSNRVKSVFDTFKSGSNTTRVFDKLKQSTTTLISSVDKLAKSFGSFLNNEYIQNASKLTASIFSLNIVTNGAAESSIKFAESLDHIFGIDTKTFVSDMGEFTGTLYGLGLASEHVGVASENLVAMSRFLASIGAAGGDVNLVTSKLVSGMRGMTAAIDDLGVSVREAQMDSFLKNLKKQGGEFANIGTSFANLNEEARVYVRYTAIIDQVTSKYGKDMVTMLNTVTGETITLNSYLANIARSSDTVTGRINLMKQAMSSLVTTIGQGLLAAIANLSVFIIPLIKLIEKLIISIGNLINRALGWLGISIDMKAASENMLSSWSSVYKELDRKPIDNSSDAVDDLNKKLDDTGKKSKKASEGLQGFDRVNNVTSQDDSGSSYGASSDNFDYSKLFADALGDLRDMTDDFGDDFYDQLEDKMDSVLDTWKQRFKKWAEDITGRESIDFGFDWDKIKENLERIKTNIISLIKQWGTFFISIGIKFLDDINIGLIITKLTELLAVVTEVADRISKVLIPALQTFYDIALSPIATWFGEKIVEGIDWMIKELNNWAQWFEDNTEIINTFFENLAKRINTVWEILKPFLDGALTALGEVLAAFGINLRQDMKEGMEEFNSGTDEWIEHAENTLPGKIQSIAYKIIKIIDGVSKIFKALFTGEVDNSTEEGTFKTILEGLSAINSIGKTSVEIISDLSKQFGNFAVNEALPWLVDKLSKLGVWLDDHKTQIEELLTKVGGMVWDGFTIFVDLIGKLINFVVENPDTVKNMLLALVGIKIGSWAVDAAAGLGLFIMKASALKDLNTIVAALGGASGGGAAGGVGLAGVFSQLGASISGAASSISTFMTGTVAPMLPVIAAIVAAIVAVTVGIKTLWENCEPFRETIMSIGQYIGEKFNGFLDTLKEGLTYIQEKLTPLKESVTSLWETIRPVGEFLWGVFLVALRSITEALATLGGGVLGGLLDILGGIGNFILTTLGNCIGVVTGLVDVLVGLFTLNPEKFVEGIKTIGKSLLDTIFNLPDLLLDAVGGIMDAIVGAIAGIGEAFVEGIGKGILDSWDSFWEKLRGLFDNLIDSIKDFFGIHSPSTVFADFGDSLIQGLFKGIQDTWNNVSSKIKAIWEGVVKGIKDTFSGIADWFKEQFTKAKDLATGAFDGVVSTFTGIKDRILGVFRGIGDTIGNFFEPVKETFNWLGDKVNDAKNWVTNGIDNITGKTSKTKGTKITAHARGGSIAGGDLFIANENGQPELIGKIGSTNETNVANNSMIISAMKSAIKAAFIESMSMMNGGIGKQQQPIVINLNGDGIFSQSDLNKFARDIGPAIIAAQKNNSNPNFSI